MSYIFTLPKGTTLTREEDGKIVVYKTTELLYIKLTNSEADALSHSFNYRINSDVKD